VVVCVFEFIIIVVLVWCFGFGLFGLYFGDLFGLFMLSVSPHLVKLAP
jgi:uncharacterized membrane protein (DUF373 family)